MYSHDAHYGWLIPPPTHYQAATAAMNSNSLSLSDSSFAAGSCDRYGRSLSAARSTITSTARAAPYARPRIVSGPGSANGSTGNASPPQQPPSAPQTPTSLHNSSGTATPSQCTAASAVSTGFSSSYSQSSFMPVEPSGGSVFSYPGSWQSNGNYWTSSTVPGPMATHNATRTMSKC